MIPYPALAPLRIGCVRYLNSRPLIFDYPAPVCFAHPSELAVDVAAGKLDAALVPIFEALGPRVYRVVEGVAIACNGPVYSVFLAHRGPLEDVRSVVLDPGSLTSVNLVQVLLAEYYGARPRCLKECSGEAGEARLLIGNQAIAFRREHGSQWRYLDLGEEWTRRTGLPFVFAAWLLRDDLPNATEIANEFRALKKAGLRRLEEILTDEEARGNSFARQYLTENIRFDLGPREREGIELFRKLLFKHGLLASAGAPLQYV